MSETLKAGIVLEMLNAPPVIVTFQFRQQHISAFSRSRRRMKNEAEPQSNEAN